MNWKWGLALLPAMAAGLFHSPGSSALIASCLIGGAIAETLGRAWAAKKSFFADGDTLLLSLLVALILPPHLPLSMAALAAFFAVLVGRDFFGGKGQYPFHPAAAALLFLKISFPVETRIPLPADLDFMRWLFGNYAGGLGDTCVLAILGGGFLLFSQKLVYPGVPFAFLAAYALPLAAMGRMQTLAFWPGDVFFAAFFLITHAQTAPHSRKGFCVLAFLAGLAAGALRLSGEYGAVYAAVLVSGALSAWIDLWIKPSNARRPALVPA
jgi:electron transport complex protein RnfD